MTLEKLCEATLITAIPPLFPKSNAAIKDILPQPAVINRKSPYIPTVPFEPLYNIKDIYVKKDSGKEKRYD